ncbi:16S rRNA (adenine(1518)-N(6)/adenine(1519)-N(6))-dimethyltransferase RsmA [Candidatus Pelagibacter sp.]|nr:16S rRNA (adenine(1518)-N(6)/adenine(1519)-N(6))-dimethyltransferase RsmA [Candidatus Pelagibacter sp.]
MIFNPKKSLGQNFLIDDKILDKIIEIGNINFESVVIEVGPGNGALTTKIFEKKPKKITVIEKDERLFKLLNKKFGSLINIINDDMMNFSYNKYFEENLIIFGNLPYNISTQILAKWIKINSLEKFCKKLVLMFQKEVADRIVAETNTKNYGRLSILSNWKLKIEKIIDIEPESFRPSPKVKSSLLVFVPKKKYHILNDPRNLEHVTNIFFSQRRKMIKKPLKFLFKNFDEISKKLSLDLSLRPQNIDHKTYYKICELYESQLIK